MKIVSASTLADAQSWAYDALPSVELLKVTAECGHWRYPGNPILAPVSFESISRALSFQQALSIILTGFLWSVSYTPDWGSYNDIFTFTPAAFFGYFELTYPYFGAHPAFRLRIDQEIEDLSRYLIEKTTEPRS